MKKQHITLSDSDRVSLSSLLSKGSQKVRVQKRALALQLLDKGKSYKSVQKDLEISYPTILKWAKKYKSEGLSFLLDKPRSGRPLKFDGTDRAKVTALACTEPPKGYARWSLRLLSDRIVELDILEEISHTQIGGILKKINSNRIEKDNGVFEL